MKHRPDEMTPASSTKSHRYLASISRNIDLAPAKPDHFRLTINAPEIVKCVVPGQFIHILPPGDVDFLRRPISVMDPNPETGEIEILLRVIGDGTRLISETKIGDTLDIIGPCGNGYTIIPDRPAVLVGGGVGIPPLVYLAKKLKKAKIKTEILLGARDIPTLICVDDFESLGLSPRVTTEDGSSGVKGFVTEIMERKEGLENPVVYCCGPIPMLKAVYIKSRELGWTDCYASLENKLGCGVGACLGCSIPVFGNENDIYYERVCTEGPVFPASRVVFDRIN